MADWERELVWLERARDLSRQLATETDLKRLLPLILDAAIELTEAERGFLVIVQGRKPSGGLKIKVEAARGFDRSSIMGTSGHVSRTVVKRVLERGDRGLVTTSEEDADVMDVSSVQARRVLSIICAPLRLRGETRGVLYLDHRFQQQAFSEADLPVVELFASQAALAIETAELRSARAEGAERLGETLAELEDLRAAAEARASAPPPAEGEEGPGRRPLRFGRLIGGSAAMRRLYEQIERASRSWDPVLIQGESGSGKELVAREIHARGSHPQAPFLSESCAAVAESLLESELFGHKKGSFTGATADRQGLFVLAGEGTLFLDEVAEMAPSMQAKLLRVLQEGCVRPVGADQHLPIRCRVLAATHRDLRQRVAEGSFREDLYYRLDVLRVTVPALRERPEDILPLLTFFAEQSGARLDLSPRARELLTGYAWPGNVRELENEVRRLLALGNRRVSGQQLSAEVQEGRGVARAPDALAGKTLGQVEEQMVRAAMRECNGNKSRAARQLGLPRSTLYSLLERYGLA